MATYKQNHLGGMLKMWDKGESGNPLGRPKRLSSVINATGYTLDEVRDIISKILSLNAEELKNAIDDKELPILERTIAKALKNSFDCGKLESLEVLLNRSHGKPRENLTVDSKSEHKIQVSNAVELADKLRSTAEGMQALEQIYDILNNNKKEE